MRHSNPTPTTNARRRNDANRRGWPKGPEPVRASLSVPDIVKHLRLVLRLPADEPAPGEQAACRGWVLPRVADALDLGGWLGWSLAGLALFTRTSLPSMKEAADAARRVVLGLAMERTGGNITRAAGLLRVSRRNVRDCLRRLGMIAAGSDADPGPGPEDPTGGEGNPHGPR